MFRLAGARVMVAEGRTLAQDFQTARQGAALVMITAEFAAQLPSDVLESALLASDPLTLVIADTRGRVPLPDLGARTRRILGVEA
jgi:vacuolar-type H+-ATPase subunit F/Vma7